MAYETLIVDVEDHAGLIRLNRPEAMNALNTQLMGEMCDALQILEANDRVRCIILTGSDKVFAAGADIGEMAEKTFVDVFLSDHFGALTHQFKSCRKPLIAAVAGYALGGGCELAMLCDIVIAADSARFGQPEISLGIIPALGGTQRLTRAIGKAKAMDMLLTGRSLNAEEAERAGLVSRVVPAKKLMEETRSVAQKVAEKSRLATLAVKEAADASFETPLADGLLHERRLFHSLFATADRAEGMAAFQEKRAPQFRDK
ncbi:MAG: enoyl-CoA hydratase/isomerase family protein [Rhodobacteraceae bacterium]|nr:enoyl-CoA hydratase/isomerase family protein [Paracoccaceae bacterium]